MGIRRKRATQTGSAIGVISFAGMATPIHVSFVVSSGFTLSLLFSTATRLETGENARMCDDAKKVILTLETGRFITSLIYDLNVLISG